MTARTNAVAIVAKMRTTHSTIDTGGAGGNWRPSAAEPHKWEATVDSLTSALGSLSGSHDPEHLLSYLRRFSPRQICDWLWRNESTPDLRSIWTENGGDREFRTAFSDLAMEALKAIVEPEPEPAQDTALATRTTMPPQPSDWWAGVAGTEVAANLEWWATNGDPDIADSVDDQARMLSNAYSQMQERPYPHRVLWSTNAEFCTSGPAKAYLGEAMKFKRGNLSRLNGEPLTGNAARIAELEAALAQAKADHEHDLRVVTRIAGREAQRRNWCGEYEQVMDAINAHTRGDVGGREYTFSSRVYRTFTVGVWVDAPQVTGSHDWEPGEFFDKVVRELNRVDDFESLQAVIDARLSGWSYHVEETTDLDESDHIEVHNRELIDVDE